MFDEVMQKREWVAGCNADEMRSVRQSQNEMPSISKRGDKHIRCLLVQPLKAGTSSREVHDTKKVAQFVFVAMLLAGSACHPLERSRAIDNPAVAGKTIALQVCSNCHGATGVSVSPMFPKLAGQQRQYLIDQLTDFKAHSRADPNAKRFMWGFTHLSEAQIEDIATYFSDQPAALGESGDRTLIDKGRTIFALGLPDKGVAACSSCHGQHGEGAGPLPRLAGQHADYIVKQLLVFQRAEQRPRGAPMKGISDNMSEQDMRAVAVFLEAFPPETEMPTDAPPASTASERPHAIGDK